MTISRKDFIKGAASGAAGLAAVAATFGGMGLIPSASAAEKAKPKPKMSDDTAMRKEAAAKEAFLKVKKTTADCLKTGNDCLDHCSRELANGNKTMAKCNFSVQDMIATCAAMHKLASSGAPDAKSLAMACAKVCDTCAKACEEHKEHFAHGMHMECKACMDSCVDCKAACEALV